MSDAEGSTTNKERRGCGTSSSRSLGHGKEKVCGCVGKTRPAAQDQQVRLQSWISINKVSTFECHVPGRKRPSVRFLSAGGPKRKTRRVGIASSEHATVGGSATWCESTGRGMSKNFSATSLRRSPKTLATRGSCGRSGASGGRATVLTPNSNTCVGYANS